MLRGAALLSFQGFPGRKHPSHTQGFLEAPSTQEEGGTRKATTASQLFPTLLRAHKRFREGTTTSAPQRVDWGDNLPQNQTNHSPLPVTETKRPRSLPGELQKASPADSRQPP